MSKNLPCVGQSVCKSERERIFYFSKTFSNYSQWKFPSFHSDEFLREIFHIMKILAVHFSHHKRPFRVMVKEDAE